MVSLNHLRSLLCLWALVVTSPLFSQFVPENHALLYLDRAISKSSIGGATDLPMDGLMKLDYLRFLSNNNLVGVAGIFTPIKAQGTATGRLVPVLETGEKIKAGFNSLGTMNLKFHGDAKKSSFWTSIMETPFRLDKNQDDFLDVPVNRQWTGLYQHRGTRRNFSSLTTGYWAAERQIAGQQNFRPSEHLLSNAIYGFGHHLYQLGGETKLEFKFPNSSQSDQILQLDAGGFLHDFDGYVGPSIYREAEQQLTLGVNFEAKDDVKTYTFGLLGSWRRGDSGFGEQLSLRRTLSWYGLGTSFQDYLLVNLRLQASLRILHHNVLKWQAVPSLKLDYQPSDRLDLRIGVFGEYNYRFSELWNENRLLLQSARKIELPTTPTGDKMWKFGTVLQGDSKLDSYYSDWLLSYKFSYCHWSFPQKMVLDLQDPSKAVFRETQEGASWDRVEAQLGVRMRHNFMVKSNYTYQYSIFRLDGEQLEEPFSVRHHWMNTLNWRHSFLNLGLVHHLKSARLFPDVSGRDLVETPGTRSPWFHRLDVDVALDFKEWVSYSSPWYGFNVQVGVRNLTGLRQPFPFLGYEDPFGGQFDASLQWGSVYGAQYYLSLNYDLQ